MERAAEMSGRSREKQRPCTFPNSIEVIAFATDANADWIILLKQMANTNRAHVNHCWRTRGLLDMFCLIHRLESVGGRNKMSGIRGGESWDWGRRPHPSKGQSWRHGSNELSNKKREKWRNWTPRTFSLVFVL